MQPEDSFLQSLLSRLDSIAKANRPSDVVEPESATATIEREPAEQPAGSSLRSEAATAWARATKAMGCEEAVADEVFLPLAPKSLDETGVSETPVEAIVLKLLMKRGALAGRAIGEQIGLAFGVIEPLLARLKSEQLVVYRNASALGDYFYQLTEKGIAAAQRVLAQGSYSGTVPVPFDDYLAAVHEQSISRHRPTMADILPVYDDMQLDPMLLNQLGQALDAGKGFFLYGAPGNGKTTIAERVSQVFGQFIWIPRTLVADGQLVRLFDPCAHQEAPLDPSTDGSFDKRWVRIRRPAIVVGGELVFESLDLAPNAQTGLSEAPLQLKSNCGTLVIDDFGRQRISTAELLNRWIVPLDRGHDYLHLPGGKSLRVPFDQLLVFSTNLEPRDLVDEAFLRRIPYKIEVRDPSEDEFHGLLAKYAARYGIDFDRPACEYLVERHFRQAGRVPRRCHARDMMAQVHHFCRFNGLPAAMSAKNFDMAVMNYFALAGD
jgi:predicted ATPase with chaperone activity